MGQLIQLFQMLPAQVVGLLQILLWGVVAVIVAWRMGFFQMPQERWEAIASIRFSHLVGAFVIYLGVQLVLMPALAVAWASVMYGDAEVDSQLSKPLVDGWVNISGIVVAFPLLIGYSRSRTPAVWEHSPKARSDGVRALAIGAATWFVAFPVVTFAAEGVKDISRLLVRAPTFDQIAVRHLKDAAGDPLLIVVSVLAIIILVPVIEELLFRGFLQSWLITRFPPLVSIVISSLIFTGVHFSPSQGIANVELMTGLFLLALFLGYLYQRQGSLWAPIGLHCTFNAISVTVILLGVGTDHV